MKPITIAIPKGRIAQDLSPLFAKAGIDASLIDADDRRLVRTSPDGRFRFLLLKPDDVPTYVEYGVAEVGVSGRDVLLEHRYELYQPLDLGIGRCRLVVARPVGGGVPAVPRVATKFPRAASEHFHKRGVPAQIIPVGGSVELAPLVGLADLIVDLVQSGNTLKQNQLEVHEVIAEISSVLVVNRALFKLRHGELAALIHALERAVHAS